jgi:hypothetical protein
MVYALHQPSATLTPLNGVPGLSTKFPLDPLVHFFVRWQVHGTGRSSSVDRSFTLLYIPKRLN